MIIYSIAIFPLAEGANAFSASLTSDKKHREKIIKTQIKPMADTITAQPGYTHKLTTPTEIFYALIEADKISIIATDITELKPENKKALFKKISAAKNKHDLDLIIKSPDEAAKSTIDLISETVADTKEILYEDIEALLRRGEKLEALLPRIQELAKLSSAMRINAVHLANNYKYCPGLFSFFASIHDFFTCPPDQADLSPKNKM